MERLKLSWKIQALTETHAREILVWQYPPPYDYYNVSIETWQETLADFLDLRYCFHAIVNPQRELEGFCSYGDDGSVPGGDYDEPALDIGMGIRPDLTGQGHGVRYAQAVVRYAVDHYQAKRLRVTIAEFNQRAQQVWGRIGFVPVSRFWRADSTRVPFVIMTYDVQ